MIIFVEPLTEGRNVIVNGIVVVTVVEQLH
jgi:hypothetical protein